MTQDMHVYETKKRATREMNRSTHTLSILEEQLRSSLGAGKSMVRVCLEHVLPSTKRRFAMTRLLLLMAGVNVAWGESVSNCRKICDSSGGGKLSTMTSITLGSRSRIWAAVSSPSSGWVSTRRLY